MTRTGLANRDDLTVAKADVDRALAHLRRIARRHDLGPSRDVNRSDLSGWIRALDEVQDGVNKARAALIP